MNRLGFLFFTFLLLASKPLSAQVLTEWVENPGAGQSNEIVLGYPVPIPVDTPLPFDGFRTYAGLHTRHQDLAATTPWVHPEQIGLTQTGRTIWAYRLGDNDLLTTDGLAEPATLTNGGIHAREWQSPEVVTGIMELLALHENDHHFYDYLRDNVNMIVIPSLNIDGFLQTQRYPTLNYLQSDPEFPNSSPRDGRMRRKNMLSVDEDLSTTIDHLNGVDLNRNNNPYWGRNPSRSSAEMNSIVYRGAAVASEPETRALDVAAQLGPIDRLRMYTDVHSFSMVQFWVRNDNARLSGQTEKVLRTFADHHRAFPAEKFYFFAGKNTTPRNRGIGATDEYFTFTYQVPSWTLEVEPSGGQSYHAPLPGGGADYGGTGDNGHDGFILPDAEIRRVREQLAQSFAAVYYRQAGPPSIQSVRIIDPDTLAVVYEAQWNVVDAQSRSLYSNQLQALQLNHDYDLWLSFDKPMRWRVGGEVAAFPGQLTGIQDIFTDLLVGSDTLTAVKGPVEWLNLPGGATGGYVKYQDDAARLRFSLPGDEKNLGLVVGDTQTTLSVLAWDMTGMRTDADPASIADWSEGAWARYDSAIGKEGDTGGFDRTLLLQVTNQAVTPPFLLEAGITSSWYDPAHDGEGFQIEMLADNVAVMYWYTFDKDGAQDWYVAVGDVRGNSIEFSELYRVSGGEFGAGFDPAKITREDVGSASFVWSGCDQGTMSYRIGTQQGHLQLSRLTSLMGLDCGQPRMSPISEVARLSGSWYDPSHDGEGFNVEVLANGGVVVYWFSYDPLGQRRWFFGVGEVIAGKLVFANMLTSSGGIFGPGFDPATVNLTHWGSLELDLTCHSGTASYNSSEVGFGSGVLHLVRLTGPDGLGCP